MTAVEAWVSLPPLLILAGFLVEPTTIIAIVALLALVPVAFFGKALVGRWGRGSPAPAHAPASASQEAIAHREPGLAGRRKSAPPSVSMQKQCNRKAFNMMPLGRSVPALHVPDDRMDWFEDIASRVYEVRHGIIVGEVGGEQLPGWKPRAFREALYRLRRRAREIGWPEGGVVHDPLDDVALTQRLIASALDVEDAAKLVKDYADFRKEMNGAVAPTREWLEYGIVICPCEDRLGRPILNIRPRFHKPGNLKLFRLGLRVTLDAIKTHKLHNRKSTFSETNPLEQYTLVWDFAGAGWSNLDWEAFHCTLEEGAYHYPNMGSQVYVLNVSAPVRWVWKAASKLMHPRVRRKCFLISPQDVPACMRRVVAPELLPPEYGGTGPAWPGPAEARTLEDQVGAITAEVLRRCGAVPAGAKPFRRDLEETDSNSPEDEDRDLPPLVRGSSMRACAEMTSSRGMTSMCGLRCCTGQTDC